MTDTIRRRSFIQAALLGAAVIPVAGVLQHTEAAAPAAALPMLDVNDPTAKALGYVIDAKKVDAKANATYKPGQICGNCDQYLGKPTDKAAPCPLYPGKQVHVAGWCKVWAAKPA